MTTITTTVFCQSNTNPASRELKIFVDPPGVHYTVSAVVTTVNRDGTMPIMPTQIFHGTKTWTQLDGREMFILEKTKLDGRRGVVFEYGPENAGEEEMEKQPILVRTLLPNHVNELTLSYNPNHN
ncbi:hypothetical protein niasHT_039880 [Heterodera trifolii]|uniref:Uncharacterized protein n=1 Tax=Heterodera trifolii TaxID=157864 RepID=A0ABD2IFX1_9BILA